MSKKKPTTAIRACWELQKKNIKSIKNQYDDNLLCEQTLINLDFYIYANENLIYYVELISDSIDGNEFEQASVLKQRVNEFRRKGESKKKTYYFTEHYKWFIDHYETKPRPKTQKPLEKGTIKGNSCNNFVYENPETI